MIISNNIRVYHNVDKSFTPPETRVGFCRNMIHRGFLTKGLMEQHECIEKNCKYFIKYENSNYWQQKAEKKEQRKKYKAIKKFWEERCDHALYLMRDLTKDIECVGITSATMKDEKTIEIRYVSTETVDLHEELMIVREATGVKCVLTSIKNNPSMKKKLIDMFNPESPDYLNDEFLDSMQDYVFPSELFKKQNTEKEKIKQKSKEKKTPNGKQVIPQRDRSTLTKGKPKQSTIIKEPEEEIIICDDENGDAIGRNLYEDIILDPFK